METLARFLTRILASTLKQRLPLASPSSSFQGPTFLPLQPPELAPVLLASYEPRTLQRSYLLRTRTTSYLGHKDEWDGEE